MRSNDIKNLLKQEAVETEIAWLENDTVEGISSDLALLILADRKQPPKPPTEKSLADYITSFQFLLEITVDTSEIDKVRNYVRSIGYLVSETETVRNTTINYDASFYIRREMGASTTNYYLPAANITNDVITRIGLSGYSNYKIGIKLHSYMSPINNAIIGYPPAEESQIC